MCRKNIQYFCAVLLIVSSIALAFKAEEAHGDIASGVLFYIAQAFLLAASIFGLDYYTNIIKDYVTKRTEKQQPTEYQDR